MLTQNDLSSSQMNYLQLMYDQGVPQSTIADIMSQVVNKDEKNDEFISSTIRNIGDQTQKAMDEIAGISPDFSVAKKTLLNLKVSFLLSSNSSFSNILTTC